MVSMKDVANVCGVSVATVSKALNNQRDVGEETKERIRRVAKELGYFPNSAARALKTNESRNLGVLLVDESKSGLTHDYYACLLDSFKRAAEAKGYDITFVNCSSTLAPMSYLERVHYRGLDGVLIACIDFYDPQVQELVRGDVPVVTIDHVFQNCMAVVSDNIGGMRDLLNYVHKNGHRRIAYIHGRDSSVTHARLVSFYKTAAELGLQIPDAYIRLSEYRSTEQAYAATVELLNLPEPPTCILYPDDFSSFGGMSAIQERGLRIPQDVSIAGYDGIRIGRYMEPKLTTLWQDTESMGKKAAELLIRLIDNPATTVSEQVHIRGTVYEGGTVAAIEALP